MTILELDEPEEEAPFGLFVEEPDEPEPPAITARRERSWDHIKKQDALAALTFSRENGITCPAQSELIEPFSAKHT